ncbi:hypothetical protein [Chitiniphilus shinanonensis]|nr:hypothetical protein [Chitiniphilus shinanonensis]
MALLMKDRNRSKHGVNHSLLRLENVTALAKAPEMQGRTAADLLKI